MTFFASSRRSDAGRVEQLGAPNGAGTVEATGLPPWVESAVKKLLASVLPQFQPLVSQAETVLGDARETFAQQRRDQLAVLNALAELREAVLRLEKKVGAL